MPDAAGGGHHAYVGGAVVRPGHPVRRAAAFSGRIVEDEIDGTVEYTESIDDDRRVFHEWNGKTFVQVKEIDLVPD